MKKLLMGTTALVALCASRAVWAADLAPPVVYKAPPAQVWSWTGFYIGGNVGYSWGDGRVTYNEPALGGYGLPTSFSGTSYLAGVIGGPEIGYNWQLDTNWVAGLEADFQWSAESGNSSFTHSYDCEGSCALSGTLSSKIEWLGTVRSRIGWLVNPTTLVYATGGLAYGEVKASGVLADSYYYPPYTWSFSGSSTNVGWTVGAGIEAVVPTTINWTWKLEYLYVDLGSLSGNGYDTDFGGPYTWSARFIDNIFRVGVNYHFH